MSNGLKKFSVICTYHTVENTSPQTIWARDEADAESIAKLTFDEKLTKMCVLDTVHVMEDK